MIGATSGDVVSGSELGYPPILLLGEFDRPSTCGGGNVFPTPSVIAAEKRTLLIAVLALAVE
jgi:hypothetical protein